MKRTHHVENRIVSATIFLTLALPLISMAEDDQFKTHSKGFIGLQVHGAGNQGPFTVAWRKIRIKVMDKE